MKNKYSRNVPGGSWQASPPGLRNSQATPRPRQHISLAPAFRGCPTASFKTSSFWHLGKDMDYFLLDCCHPKAHCIFTGHYPHQYTSWTWSSVNSPLANTLLTCKEFLSLLPTGSTFCLEEPLKKSVSNTDYANTRHSFHLGYKLGSISAVCSSHHSFHLSLPFSSSSGLVLYLQRPHTYKVSPKNLLHIQHFHCSFTSQQEKTAAFITSAHVEHQFLGFVLIFSKSLIT